MSLGGYGVQGSDPNLADKLAKLKSSRQSPTDRLNSFLEKDMGVDPHELPMNLGAARKRMHEILQDDPVFQGGPVFADFVGNSMGLKSVLLTSTDAPDGVCPSCGYTTGYWHSEDDSNIITDWYCYECEEHQGILPEYPEPKVITADNPDGCDWHDILRIYTAFNHYLPEGEENVDKRGTVYRFRVSQNYRDIDVTTVDVPAPNPDPTSYETGRLLRVEKHVIDEHGAYTSHREYVRIGGLFNESDVTILSTMQPIEDLTGWNVVEEL